MPGLPTIFSLQKVTSSFYAMMTATSDVQIIGKERKALLYDVEKMTRFEMVSYINALVHWNKARIDYSSQCDGGEIDGNYALQFCREQNGGTPDVTSALRKITFSSSSLP